MPRVTDATTLLRKLTAVDLYRLQTGTIGDTTTSALTAKGAATLALTGFTNFTSGDPVFLIGSGGMELISAIGTPGASTPITNQKVHFAQNAGARVVEAQKISLGKIGKKTTKFSPSKSLTAIFSDVDDGAIAYLDGPIEIGMSFGLYDWTPLALQLALGLNDDETGAGTTADPYQGSIGDPVQAYQTFQAIRCTGLRADGKTFEIDFLNCRFEVSGEIALDARDEASIIPVSIKAPQLIWRTRT